MSNTNPEPENHGLGWAWWPEENCLKFLLEANLAKDEEGKPCPAGCAIGLSGVKKMPALEMIERTITGMCSNGIELPGYGKVYPKAITWEHHVEAGYNDD